jgi:hypothetical protein
VEAVAVQITRRSFRGSIILATTHHRDGDEAINHIKGLNAAAPDQPFLVYYAPGGSRAASADGGMDQEDQRHAFV